MAVLPILIVPDRRLRQPAAPVPEVDDKVLRLMDDMLETMYAAPGVGLAAPQVGVSKRVVVIDIALDGEPPAPLAMANPEIVAESEERQVMSEGCLSLPEQYAEVERAARVTVRYLGRDGRRAEVEGEGLLSTCLQHEIDHLDGVLFVDRISLVKRGMILRKLAKAQRDKAGSAGGR